MASPLLDGRVALVSAAGAGIGQATAVLLAERGATVVGIDVDEGRLAETAAAIGGPDRFRGIAIDATNPAGAADVVARAVEAFGRIDIITNIVGGGVRGPMQFVGKKLHEYSDEEWAGAIGFNLNSSFMLCRAAIPQMIAGGGGAIVNVASIAAITALAKTAPYAAAKAALIAMTRTMALDYADHGIRVNCIAPGTTLTPLLRSLWSPEDIEQIAETIMLRRGAEPREIASVIAFLASDDASFITGQLLPVEGGLRIGSMGQKK